MKQTTATFPTKMTQSDLRTIIRIKEKAVKKKRYDLACYLRAAQNELEKLIVKS